MECVSECEWAGSEKVTTSPLGSRSQRQKDGWRCDLSDAGKQGGWANIISIENKRWNFITNLANV